MLITGARGAARRRANQSYIIRVKNKTSPGYSRRFISIRSLSLSLSLFLSSGPFVRMVRSSLAWDAINNCSGRLTVDVHFFIVRVRVSLSLASSPYFSAVRANDRDSVVR